MTQVFKFGGASIETPERAAKVAQIIQAHLASPLVVVISAKGKTTNALELIARAYFDGEKETYQELYQNLEKDHLEYAQALLQDKSNPAYQQLTQFFTEMDWILSEVPGRNFDYYYDQIVCLGELLSTTILAAYLKQEGIPTHGWISGI